MKLQRLARFSCCLAIFFGVFLAVGHCQEDETGRVSIPTKDLREKVRAGYEQEFDFENQRSKFQKRQLAEKVLRIARSTRTGSAQKFVLLDMYRELAADAGNAARAMDGIMILEQQFKVNTFSLTLDIIRRVGESPDLNLRDRNSVFAIGKKLLDEKMQALEFEDATELCPVLIGMAKKHRYLSALQYVQSRHNRILSGEAEEDAVRAARQTLQDDPLDTQANWTVARYELLLGTGWDAAAPFLDRASIVLNSPPASTAGMKDGSALFEEGKQWIAVAGRAKPDKLKRVFLLHAIKLFYKAEVSLQGRQRELVKTEIANLERQGIKFEFSAKMRAEAQAMAQEIEAPPWKIESAKEAARGARQLQDDVLDLRWSTFKEIDVLKAIDVTKHKLRGKWQAERGDLRSPNEKFSCIRMPFVFPEQYDLRIECKRGAGKGNLTMSLPASTGHRFLVQLDRQHSGSNFSGLELIDGKTISVNGTRYEGEVFQRGRHTRIDVSVRREMITILAGGKPIIRYRGPQNVLRCRGRGPWQDKHDLTSVLGTFESVFEFQKIRLTSFVDRKTWDVHPLPEKIASGTDRVGFRRGDASIPNRLAIGKQVHLDSVPEAAFYVGVGTMGRGGNKGYSKGAPVIVEGRKLKHAISLHPPSAGAAHVQYHLQGQFKTLSIKPSVADDGAKGKIELKFMVYGDGRLLKQSPPVTKPGIAAKWKIDIQNVQTLLLVVQCGKNNHLAHAVWTDPNVLR